MVAVVSPSIIAGAVTAPASKSVMQRACALALLNNGCTTIQHPGISEDDVVAIDIIGELGATITEAADGSININSKGNIRGAHSIACGESGLSMRMFTAIAALGDSLIQIGGKGSLLKRAVGFPDDLFPKLKVQFSSNNGFLPVSVCGPLQPSDINIDGSLSSQYLTGILFSLAKAAKETIRIGVDNLKSRPYIDLSLQMLKHFGYDVQQTGYRIFTINPVDNRERNITCHIEGDWSNAAFLLVAGATSGTVVVKGLDLDSVQADRAILEVLTSCGVDITRCDDHIRVTNKNKLQPFDFDATHCPDLFPPLAILAACCNGRSTIKGVSRLIGKESNRAEALKDVLSAMKINLQNEGDLMLISGGTGIAAGDVDAHGDHRIAMAAAIAALAAKAGIRISGAESVNKSYPAFFDHLQLLGAGVSLINN